MKIISIILLAGAVLASGCSSTKVARENAAGDKFSAKNTRWFWKSEGIDVAFSSKPDGTVTASAKIQNSSAEADQLKSAVSDVLDKLKEVK
jgi:hypothetical protein